MRERIHKPANGNADEDEEAEGPGSVFQALGWFAAAERAKRERNNQCEEHHRLKMGKRDVHSRVRLFFRVLLRKRAERKAD